jgi:UDP-glucose 4-epimerase
MSKVILTGAAGFIASHIYDLLIKEGHRVLCIDDLSSGKRENLPPDADFIKVNVASWYDLVAEFVDFEPEVVIHLAAQPSICESFDNPIRDGHVNVMGTLNIIRASQKVGVERLVFSSTSAVYAEIPTENPMHEEFPCHPQSPYGVSKMAAESYVRLLMPSNSTVLRFGNVYGPRQVPLGGNQVVPQMILHFLKGDKFYIHGDGNQERDLVYVNDVAQACLLAITGKTGIYNISSGRAISVNCIATAVEELFDVPGYLWQHDDQQDPRRKVELFIAQAMTGLGWEPKIELKDGLQKTVDWWKAQ